MSFDASFDCPRFFVMDLLPKIVSTKVPLRFADSSEVFILLHKQKRSGRCDAPSIAWNGRGGIQRRLGCWKMVWLRYSLEADHFFKLFFPSAANYYDFIHI